MREGFYNQNLGRSFPFVDGSTGVLSELPARLRGLPGYAIVDAGFIVGQGSGFDEAIHSIYLDQIERAGNIFYFRFRSDAPGLAGHVLTFTRQVDDPDMKAEFVDVDGNPHVDYVEPPPASATILVQGCAQLGSSGTFIPAYSGRLRFYFNDWLYNDNVGGYTLTFNGVNYAIDPLLRGGVAGPAVQAGESYNYSATGTVTWRPDGQQSTPDGAVSPDHASRMANGDYPCPGLRAFSLVARLEADDEVTDFEVETCEGELVWSGYLVTGQLAKLAQLLNGDGVVNRESDEDAIVEPSLIQNIDNSYVRAINIANDDRTRVDAPSGCDPIDWPYLVGADAFLVDSRCVRGKVQFVSGFNMQVSQLSVSNQVGFYPAVGAGLGEACEEVPLFPTERPYQAGVKLDGSPACGTSVRSINGVGGRFATLVGGQGVSVRPQPLTNTVNVDVNLSGLSVCYGSDIVDVSEIV